MLRFRNELFSVITVLAAVSLGACGDGVGVDNQATVRVLLTDAPVDYIAVAEVDIGVIELIRDGDGAPETLSVDGTLEMVDLLLLAEGVTTLLADVTVPAGTYTQLRLIIEAAHVVLEYPYVFNNTGNSEMNLKVPSGAQTGIKLNLGVVDGEETGPLVIAPGETVVLVVDFDVNESFVIQGDPDTPAGINGVLFTPTLSVTASTADPSTSTP